MSKHHGKQSSIFSSRSFGSNSAFSGFDRARCRRRPIALVMLAAFVGIHVVFPMAAVYAQTGDGRKPGQTTAPPAPVKPVPGSKPGQIKPSKNTGCGPGGNCDVSMKALDLSRPPSEKELRMAGQLGGALSPLGNADVPTLEKQLDKELKQGGIPDGLAGQAAPNSVAGQTLGKARKKITRLKDINLSFGKAMQEWNKHNFRPAAKMFGAHMKEFPDSPWAGETALHLGCDSKYNGRFAEAEARYDAILNSTSSDPAAPSHEIHQKAKLRWADLDIGLGRLGDARAKLLDILKTDGDWRRKTWALHWLRNVGMYEKNARDLRACGTRALAVVLASLGQQQQADKMALLKPKNRNGFSLAELSGLAGRSGLPMRGFKARAAQLAALPMPLIVHYDFSAPTPKTLSAADKSAQGRLIGRKDALASGAASKGAARATSPKNVKSAAAPYRIRGSAGHFFVVQSVDKARGIVHLMDPQERRRYSLSYSDLDREWSGQGLMLAKPGRAGRTQVALLSQAEMNTVVGGCCGVARKESGQGKNRSNNKPCVAGTNGCSTGSPVVSVNRVNMNIYVEDTPIWYSPAVGPSVDVTMSYNSQDSLTLNNPFGNKWMLNYGSYVVEDTGDGGGVVTVFNPDGSKTNFTPNGTGGYLNEPGVFDTLQKLSATRYQITSQDGSKAIYDIPAGTTSLQPFLIELRDPWGYALIFGYDADVRLTTITDALGQVTQLVYDAQGHISRIWDPFGRHADFSYDANGNMVEAIDTEGQAFQYTYDELVQITQLQTAQGPWQFAHQTPGRDTWQQMVLAITDPAGGVERYSYNGVGGPIVQTDQRGQATNWFINAVIGDEGQITDTQAPNGTVEHTDYDPASSLPVAHTDARNRTTQMTYNAQGQVTSVTDAKNQTTTINYGANGLDVASVVNALGQTVVSYGAYNAQHQPLSVTDALNQTSTMTYTAWGDALTATDASGQTTTFSYDAASKRLLSVSRGGAVLGSVTYDAVGRVKTATDALGLTLSYEYNTLDKVTRVSYPDGTSEETDYVCCGLAGMTKDRAGRKTYYDYDALKRLTRVQDAAGQSVEMNYDAAGNRTRLIDAKGNETRWSYDSLDRVVGKSFADGSSQSFSYDSVDNLTATRDAKGQVTNYAYDANDNLTGIDYPNMADVSFQYNALDDVTQVVDGVGTHSFGYDVSGRLTSQDGPFAGDEQSFGFDAQQRLQSHSLGRGASGGSFSQSYAYDALERVQSLTSSGPGGAGAFTYNYKGNTDVLSRLDLPNGTRVEQEYDALHRLAEVKNLSNAGANLASYAYAYDTRDVRTGVTSQMAGEPLKQVTYSYDTVDQLTGEVATGGAANAAYSNAFTYDSMGNRTQLEHLKSANTTLTTGTPNRLNQLSALSRSSNGLTSTTALLHDSAGNLTQTTNSDGSKTLYTYDDADRLWRIEWRNAANAPLRKSEFTFDYASRKAVSAEFLWQAGAWALQSETRRVFDGLDVVQERNGANEVTAQLTRDGNIGGILARSTASGVSYFGYDGGGNVTLLTDEAGAEVGRYSYDAFGNTLEAAGVRAGENPYRFSTKELHAPSGLYDYGYRFYSPSMSRWINRDPIAESGGLNLYAMVTNNPVNYVDTDGLARVEFHWRSVYYDKWGVRVETGGNHAYILVWNTDSKGRKVGNAKFFGGYKGSGTGWGTLLTARYGDYAPASGYKGCPDYNLKPGHPQHKGFFLVTALKDNKPASAYINRFKIVANKINGLKLKYDWTGYNSNSVARTLIRDGLGIDVSSKEPWGANLVGSPFIP